jgi:hypothetical protein
MVISENLDLKILLKGKTIFCYDKEFNFLECYSHVFVNR